MILRVGQEGMGVPMKLIKQSKPQCLLYAFAMVLDEDPEALISEIGRDGLEVCWDVVGNRKYRGHHPQELIDCCVARDFMVMKIEAVPCFVAPDSSEIRPLWSSDYCSSRFMAHLKECNGVLTNTTHAVAWCCEEHKIYDPNGHITDYENFTAQYFFAVY